MTPRTVVFSFPVKAPDSSVIADDVSALDQLELWLVYQKYWCEHKPSVTIYVGEDEWDEVREWTWEHRHLVSGISFLPRTEHTYKQAPYEALTEEQFEEMSAAMPSVDFAEYSETEDHTIASQQLACSSGVCEI